MGGNDGSGRQLFSRVLLDTLSLGPELASMIHFYICVRPEECAYIVSGNTVKVSRKSSGFGCILMGFPAQVLLW